uniref:Uncharacterized protein n=1 Tax=Arundo donax TaxID=35708 RepID=A0A0A8YEE1_ARUDO
MPNSINHLYTIIKQHQCMYASLVTYHTPPPHRMNIVLSTSYLSVRCNRRQKNIYKMT